MTDPTAGPDPITRLSAALSGRYSIERELGEGGMATVYLAKDLKHNRNVALKVLKPELAAVVGAERFLAEIETTANLQHPHILPLFDSGEADSFLFYVMPFVEGESLRDRLDREHQLPVEDAVEIAKNLAEALDYAHGKGVIHRDIKPANILLQAGKPVIADFGIALAVGVAGGGRLTETGLSMGTPHYMSPEQATGDVSVGAATDLYALGCVLYEMLVGEPPYTGTTAQAILGKILAGELASANKHRASVPDNVESAIRKALEKLPADRFTSAAALARALSDPGFRHGEPTKAGAGVSVAAGSWNRLTVAFASLFVVASAVALWAFVRPQPRPVALLEVTLGEGRGVRRLQGTLGTHKIEIARDDSRIVFVGPAPDGEEPQLWRRELDELEPHPILGTERAVWFALSPDGRAVAFADPTGIKQVSLDGGPPVDLDSQEGRFPAWGADGMVYFGREGIIYRVPERGGEAEAVTTPTAGRVHGFPHVLPDGAGVLVTLLGGGLDDFSIGVAGPEGGAVQEILEATKAHYVESGHIVYSTSDGTLMAVPFDLERLETVGSAFSLSALGGTDSNWSLSDLGTLVYSLSGDVSDDELVWVSRSGAVEPVDPSWTGDFGFPALSPDGTRLALDVSVEGQSDIWVKELDSGRPNKLTLEGSINDHPIWTPDGESVTFLSNRAADGGRDVWSKPANGGLAELELDRERDIYQVRWSPDYEWLVYRTDSNARGRADLLAIRRGQDTEPVGLREREFGERQPTLSPDGRWMAYVSEETGSYEVYVVPFPVTDERKWPISTNGGTEPLWSHRGGEIFYRDGQGDMIAVQIETDPTFSMVREDVLFSAAAFKGTFVAPVYDVSPDDSRFLMIRTTGQGGNEDTNLVVVQNFFEVMKERMEN